MRVLVVLSLFLSSSYFPSLANAEDAMRPNVLLVVADDLNTDFATFGNQLVDSPNIDRLARQGVRFQSAYVQYPVCTPSRSSFLTGLYPEQTGVTKNRIHFRDNLPNVVTLPELFKDNGYWTGRVGKIYHYDVPMGIGTDGLDDPQSWNEVVNPRGIDRDDRVLSEMNLVDKSLLGSVHVGGSLSWMSIEGEDEAHTDAMVATEAIRLLAENHPSNTGRPFFLAVGFFRPHVPFIAPKKYFDKFQLADISLDSYESDRRDIPVAALSDNPKESEMTDLAKKEAIRAYYASVSFVDAQLGRVLNALDEQGLKESTIVVFLSDHGYLLGEHQLWQKGNLFEKAARTPLIISAPGMRANGHSSNSVVEFVDLFPTIAELAQVASPDYLPGRSLTPVLDDTSVEVRSSAFTHAWSRAGRTRPEWRDKDIMGYSIRTARYRYTLWDEGRHGVELYDYEQDPDEAHNLAGQAGVYEIQQSLHRELMTRKAGVRELSVEFLR